MAVDADSSGNTARNVENVDECVSATAGRRIDIDIVIPIPGVPADRGIAGYELQLFYDPLVLSITAEDANILLAQAAGSTVIPFSDSTANNDGDYVALAVDFGSGIEPDGASETGPGVLVRFAVSPLRDGSSPLVLRDPKIYGDDGDQLAVESVRSAGVYVGQPCPSATPSPGASPTLGASASPTSRPGPPPGRTAAPAGVGFGPAGGPPVRGDAEPWLLLASASAMMISGALLLVGSGRAAKGE